MVERDAPRRQGRAPPRDRVGYQANGDRATYKRRELRAIVTKDGEVQLRGRVFATPSAAAEPVRRRPRSAWRSWRYDAELGTWVRLAGLRGK